MRQALRLHLLHHAGAVDLHGARAHAQVLGDGLVGLPGHQPVQHLTLPRRQAVQAAADAILLRFPRRQLEAEAVRDPAAARGFYDIACRSLETAQRRMMVPGRKTAAERLAFFLLEMAERTGGDRRFDLPMSRQDIADHLGLTTETVSRVFSQFRRKGLIALPTAQRVELRDHDAVEAASGDCAA